MIREVQLQTVVVKCTFVEKNSTYTARIPLKWVLPQRDLENLEEEIQCGLEALIMQFPEHVKSLDGSGKIDDG